MSKGQKSSLIGLSALALLNVAIVPIFDLWGGLWPEDPLWNFSDIIEAVIESESDYIWNYWVVRLTMSFFIPSVIMLFCALCGWRILFRIANAAGIFLWFKEIILYCMQYDGVESLFDFEDGCIAIGTWFAIIIFFISFSAAKSKEQKDDSKAKKRPAPLGSYTTKEASPETTSYSNKTCPSCGFEQPSNRTVCWKCSFKFDEQDNTQAVTPPTVEPTPKSHQRFENEWVCGNCGKTNLNSRSDCWCCGAKLED